MTYPTPTPSPVRRPGQSAVASVASDASRVATIFLGVVALVAALHFAKMILAPVALAIVLSLMLGPPATWLEQRGIPVAISAAAIVFGFVALIVASVLAFAVPLSSWIDQLPAIWARLQSELRDWQGLFSAISSAQEQLREAMGRDTAMTVTVDDGAAMTEAAIIAPAILAQIITFLASMYFFLATRDRFRAAVLSMCISRRLRWRVARVFRDAERYVSSYLVSITLINLGLGALLSLLLWVAGVPSPLLWGVLATVLNYVIYVGPALMAVLLFLVGLATFQGAEILLPPAIFLGLNLIESQFVTPHVIGRNLTLNPFVVFLSIVFWLWLWGLIGGIIAVPMLLILYAILNNILPTRA